MLDAPSASVLARRLVNTFPTTNLQMSSTFVGQGKSSFVGTEPAVSIIIPTFRRENDLKTVIDRCLRQYTYECAGFEIVVVDNSPERSAELTVEGIDSGDITLRYLHEPKAGISHARNSCIKAAHGHFLALIDDDEIPEPDWLYQLTRTQSVYDADVVFGPVHPRFDMPLGRDRNFLTAFYTYSLSLPTGSPVGVRSTNNALIRRVCLDHWDEPFDTNLGLTGGEDTLFFSKLQAMGKKFVWSAEAIVTETIPAQRITWSTIWKRSFQRGQCRASTPALLSPPRMDKTLFWMGIGAVQLIGLLPIVVLLWLPDRQRALLCAWKMVSGLGKIFWMKRFRPTTYGASVSNTTKISTVLE